MDRWLFGCGQDYAVSVMLEVSTLYHRCQFALQVIHFGIKTKVQELFRRKIMKCCSFEFEKVN